MVSRNRQLHFIVLVVFVVSEGWGYEETTNGKDQTRMMFRALANEPRAFRSTANQQREQIATGSHNHGNGISKRRADLSINQDLQVIAEMLLKDRKMRLKSKYINLRSQLRKLGKRDVMSGRPLNEAMFRENEFKNIESQLRRLGNDDVEDRMSVFNENARIQPEVTDKDVKRIVGMETASTPQEVSGEGLVRGFGGVGAKPPKINKSGIFTEFVKYEKLVNELKEMLKIQKELQML